MKIFDGFHPVHYEITKHEGSFRNPEAFGKGSTQKVFVFANGYGASVVKGFFTFGYDELAVLRFRQPFRLRSKKKRHVKKYLKRFNFDFDIDYSTPVTQDVKRYSDSKELINDLNLIVKLKPGRI